MSLRPLIAWTSLVLLLVGGRTATAAEWQGAEPGVTSTQELLRRFGKPAKRYEKGGMLLLDYRGRSLPRDTRSVRFSVDADQDVLQRIDVFPKKPPKRATLEALYGPACAKDGPPEEPCYEVQASADNQLAFHYPALGLDVFFSRGRVRSMTYREPRRPAPAPRTEPSPPVAEEQPLVSASPEPAPEPAPTSPAEPEPEPAAATATTSADLDMSLRPAVIAPDEPSGQDTAGPAPTPGSGTAPARVTVTDAEALPDEPAPQRDLLSLGGIYFQRAELYGTREALGTTRLQPTIPSLVDLYLDARPSKSVRSFVRGRLLFDPLNPDFSEPQILLDQLWLQFTLADRVFITAGRQQIKWGTSKVWNPVDFLRKPNPLPLDVFDLRTGVDMIKVNVPFESLASNLWLIATADLNGPDSQPIRYGGAARAEVVLGPGELALTGVFQQGRRPRYGLDWSMGVGIFDVNAEVALLRDNSVQRWERTADGFTRQPFGGPKLQASAGMMTQFRIADIYRFQFRLEGFYNQAGYDEQALLTWVRSTGDFQPLYFGRYYGMAQLLINRRSAFEPMLGFTVLGNVGDGSYLGRVDVAVLPVREVYVSTFFEAPFGTRGGEFRFEPDPTVAELPVTGLSLLRAGLAVRIRM